MREMFVNNFSTVAVASSKAVEKKIQHLKKNFFVVDDDGKIRTFFHFLLIHHKTVVHQSETVQFAFKFRVTTTLLIVEYFSSAVKKENFHPLQEKLKEKKNFLEGNLKKNILENFKKIKIFSRIFMTVRAKNVFLLCELKMN